MYTDNTGAECATQTKWGGKQDHRKGKQDIQLGTLCFIKKKYYREHVKQVDVKPHVAEGSCLTLKIKSRFVL